MSQVSKQTTATTSIYSTASTTSPLSAECQDKVTEIKTGETKPGHQLSNIFTLDASVWLSDKKDKGHFVVDFGCERLINMVEMYNAHWEDNDGKRGTRDFKVYLKVSGRWEQVVHGKLRNFISPFRILQTFAFNETVAREVKFQVLSYYGEGAGLMYFKVDLAGNVFLYYHSQITNHSRKM